MNLIKLLIFVFFQLLNIPILAKSLIEFPISIFNISNSSYYKTKNLEFKINSIKSNLLSSIDLSIEYKNFTISFNHLFGIKILIGTFGQEFNLILDSGSLITWIPLKGSHDKYPIEHHYDPSQSLTSKSTLEPFEETYGSGYCKGYYYQDKVNFLKNKNFDFKFGVAIETNFNVREVDGIIGLARLYDDYILSFSHMLCKNKITDSLLFSFKFEYLNDNSYSGTFFIGKHDDFYSDNIVVCKLGNDNYYEQNFWGCDMTSLIISDKKNNITITAKNKFSAIFDSGTNVLILPLDYFYQIKDDLIKINCVSNKINGNGKEEIYQLICQKNNLPELRLIIGGNTFILEPKYYFYFSKNLAFSRILFQNSYDEEDETYIIGNPFFMQFHILFDTFSKELYFYSNNSDYLIEGSWWNTSHIINIILLIFFFLVFMSLIILNIVWYKKNTIDQGDLEEFNINLKEGFLFY